jgi:hypothetical protein
MKTAGQLDYERDLQKQPKYHDGTKRPLWQKLSAIAKQSWEIYPNRLDTRSK